MSKHISNKNINTFSIGFNEKSFDELNEAGLVASYLGVNHHEKIVTPLNHDIMAAIIKSAQEPLADSSFIPMYFLAKFTREKVTVALSGDGGDECFAGYETYMADKAHHYLSWVPSWIKKQLHYYANKHIPVSFNKVSIDYKIKHFLYGLKFNYKEAHYSWRNIFNRDEISYLYNPDWNSILDGGDDAYSTFDYHFKNVKDCHYIDQAMYVDIKTWLPNDILTKVDRATMAHSLESRAPFLDHRIVEFAASLPVSMKLKLFKTKNILKVSQKNRLPKNIINRKKQGFNAPITHWLNHGLNGLIRDILEENNIRLIFDRKEIDKLMTEQKTNIKDNGLKLLGLANLAIWMKTL